MLAMHSARNSSSTAGCFWFRFPTIPDNRRHRCWRSITEPIPFWLPIPRARRSAAIMACRRGAILKSISSTGWECIAATGITTEISLIAIMARFVWYPLEADTGFFYTGTTHGQKKIIGIGASFDRQGDYSANSLDFFLDHPLNNGDAVTFQADFIRYDGGKSFTTLPKQNDWLLEGSYYFKKIKLGPYVQFASRDLSNPSSLDDRQNPGRSRLLDSEAQGEHQSRIRKAAEGQFSRPHPIRNTNPVFLLLMQARIRRAIT